MLGSVSDAEDIVQEAFLRWLDADQSAVREPEAYLRRVVTRLCLDQLKSARHRRETYVGPWLPDPFVKAPEDDVDDITLPLMLALERLSPLERAASPPRRPALASEIADYRPQPVTCRQLAAAGPCPRELALSMPGTNALPKVLRGLTAAICTGCNICWRPMSSRTRMEAADTRNEEPIVGLKTSQLHTSLARLFAGKRSRLVRYSLINGLPGLSR
jgi:RNA polymerase sigma-70 factor (ECF subfamily)